VVARCISIVRVCADQPEKVGHSECAWHFGKILRRGPALGIHGGIVKHGVEKRPYLGEGPAPTVQTVREAVRLSRWTQLAVGAMAYVFKSTSSQVLKG